MTARARLSPAQRMERFALFGFRCYVCGGDDPVDLDHMKPLHSGGEDVAANLAPICRSCHLKKTVAETTMRAKAKRLILATLAHKEARATRTKSPNARERALAKAKENFERRWTTISKRMGD